MFEWAMLGKLRKKKRERKWLYVRDKVILRGLFHTRIKCTGARIKNQEQVSPGL